MKPDVAHRDGQVPRSAKKSLLVCLLVVLPTHPWQGPGGGGQDGRLWGFGPGPALEVLEGTAPHSTLHPTSP